MERLFKLRPHLRNSRSAALSWLLFKELANDKTGRFDLPTEYQESEDECGYCSQYPYPLRFELVVDGKGNRICPDCSKPLKGEDDE